MGDREDVLRANRTQTANLVPPIRQTASIFKQPVTVFKVHESKVKNDFKTPGADKPRQLFWEKRLNGLGARSVESDNFCMNLPRRIKMKRLTRIPLSSLIQSNHSYRL